MKNRILILFASIALLAACNEQQTGENAEALSKDNSQSEALATKANYRLDNDEIQSLAKNLKQLNPDLPTIGILVFDDVLMSEITSPIDVFSKHSEDGEQLFNVITIAERYDLLTCEDGLKIFPDYTIANAPELNVLIVPSTFDMASLVKNGDLVKFVQHQNENTDFTVSNCAGATLIGESGIADGREIVTWIGGGVGLQEQYPNLKVQDDSKVSYVEDGKFLSSNGNLATYISSLELLEKLTNKAHRKYVESRLYLDRLCQWNG